MGASFVTIPILTGQTTQLWSGLSGNATSITLINLDNENTAFIGTQVNLTPGAPNTIALGPLGSVTLPGNFGIFACADPAVAGIAVVPGGAAYSPGSLTINGPVAATITGPVTVQGSVGINGPVTAEISGPVTVNGAVSVDGTVTTEVDGTVDVNVTGGTADVNITGSTVSVNTNATGVGGFILPGEVVNILTNTAALNMPPGTTTTRQLTGLQNFSSLDLLIEGSNSSTATGAALCCELTFTWTDPNTNQLGSDTVYFLVQPLGQGPLMISIPVKGSGVIIGATNNAAVGSIQIPIAGLVVDGSFRNISGITFGNPSTVGTTTLGGVEYVGGTPVDTLPDGWIASVAQPLATASTIFAFVLSQYAGLTTGMFQVNGTAPPNDPVLVDLALATVGNVVAGTANPQVIQVFPTTIASSNPINTYLPASPCALIVKSPTVTTSSIQLAIMGQR